MCEKVPSWQVTGTMLASWGFPVERTDKCVGSKVVVSAGMLWHVAVHAAWAAGFVRIESAPEGEREAQLCAFRARIEAMHENAAANLAFLREHGTILEGGRT